jgi:hypothetical protein
MLVTFVGSFAVGAWKQRQAPVMRVGFLVTAVLAVAFTSTEFQPRGLWFLAAGGIAILNREYLAQALLNKRPVPVRQLLRPMREASSPA